MKNLKKILGLFLAMAMVFSLTACQKKATKAENSIILGNSTELSGQFRYSSYGKTNPGAADLDIETLTNGLETVAKNKEGGYQWNDFVVAEHEETNNEDGSKTFKIKIKEGLVFSDGSPVTAKDYLAFSMAFISPVPKDGSGKQNQSPSVVGSASYTKYTGPGCKDPKATKEFSGLRLYDEYTFSVQISADYLPYFYDITYAAFSPSYAAMWLGEGVEIKDDGNGCYLSDKFYDKNEEGKYSQGLAIKEVCTSTNADDYKRYPYSGPYCVESFDTTTSTATLVINKNFPGNYEGTKPQIEKVVYKKIVSETQLEQFKAGELDVIAAITGGAETDEAVELADGSKGQYTYSHYSRAGYGKLGFRADYGPAQFAEVRRAIAYCMDRAQFAKDFTGGYGGVVDGAYYAGSWMYKAAMKNGMVLNAYATSSDSAIKVLEENGWKYAADGSEYVSGVRYKQIPADVISENDKNYKSKDGAYKTEKVGDFYYMPLVINWYGTTPNPFSDLLLTGFVENKNVETIGMKVYSQLGDFNPMLDELYQASIYGYYSGTPMYCAFNFATGFNSAVYDYSYNWTIDPSMYDDYSICYLKDYADVAWLIADPTNPEDCDEFKMSVANKYEFGKDWDLFYNQVGEFTIEDVEEKDGKAYINGHELGMDFLSFAMVYNCDPVGKYETADDVYAEWFRLYTQRWNSLLPEIPLYSNEYYDLYNGAIVGTNEHPTNPYWSPAEALIDWSINVK